MKEPKLTSAALYAEHWQYVYHLLPSYGIPVRRGADVAQDVAQTVWMTVHARLGTYDPELHKSPRAWITGIVRRCAANHRRTTKRCHEDLVQDELELVRDPGLNPEQSAMLLTIDQAIRNPERYEAFLLRHQHGLSIPEIAGLTGATESAVEWRIGMAKKELERADEQTADDKKKAGAFAGFGTLEALSDALQPKPLPPEMGQELWERLAPHLGAPAGPFPNHPPPPTSGGVVLAKGALVALLLGAFVVGNVTGAGGALALQARRPSVRAVEETAPAELAPAPHHSGAPLAPAAATASAMTTAASSSARSAAARRQAPPAVPTAPDPESSKLLILQMRRAAQERKFAVVLTLADEHARLFPTSPARDVAAREAERKAALRELSLPPAAPDPR